MIPQALIAAAFAAGLAVAGAAGWAINEWVDNPAIRKAAAAEAALEATAAAARATRDEQLRQFRIGEQADNAAELDRRDNEAWQQARIELLKGEIARYAAQRKNRGLDLCDLAFLDGLQCHEPGPAGGGP